MRSGDRPDQVAEAVDKSVPGAVVALHVAPVVHTRKRCLLGHATHLQELVGGLTGGCRRRLPTA
jgi:hypothetical protein